MLATGLSLKCEVDCGCLATGLPLVREVVFVLPRWRLYWLREEFSTPSGLEILLGEGGDVEPSARTSKQISLFVFDSLTLTLSLFYLYLALFILSYIYYMLGLCVCASLVPNRESFI